ncbi:MAG: thioredoxin family protein [Saezia sp.]
MHIQVYGTGCCKCSDAQSTITDYLKAHGIEATVEKVSDLAAIMKAGVMNTPAVAIDGVVKLSGRIPTEQDMAAWFSR